MWLRIKWSEGSFKWMCSLPVLFCDVIFVIFARVQVHSQPEGVKKERKEGVKQAGVKQGLHVIKSEELSLVKHFEYVTWSIEIKHFVALSCKALLHSFQEFLQCHPTSKALCFSRNRLHRWNSPTRRVQCSVVQLMAVRHPRYAGWIRRTRSYPTYPAWGKYPGYWIIALYFQDWPNYVDGFEPNISDDLYWDKDSSNVEYRVTHQ